jgi:mono/diheme cytochrome c family protein
MNIHAFGSMKKLTVLATIAVGSMSAAAHAVTPGQVKVWCGACHGLTVNGIVVSNGFSGAPTYSVNGRDQAAWVGTITRMNTYSAGVSDVNGTAAYLAGLGANAAATPTATATLPDPQATAGTPTPTATPAPAGRRTRRPTRTPKPTGAAAYGAYCARCHEPASPGFMGGTVYGASAGDIAGAIAEARQMQFLQSVLTRGTISAIARYLRSVNPGGGGDGGGGDGGGGGD